MLLQGALGHKLWALPLAERKGAKAKRTRWTKAEKDFICSWVACNKPTEGKVWDWRQCVAGGKDILSACHANNVKVKDQARTLRLLE